MIFSIIQFCMAASPFVLIAGTLDIGWKILWRLFDRLLKGGQRHV